MPCVFKALADSTRRQILAMLKNSDMSAGDIAARFDMSWPSISNHLSVLKSAGLIIGTKEGQNIIYSINTTVLEDITSWLMDLSASNKLKGENQNEI